MNLRVLTPSRARLKEGDTFALQVRDGEFLFGRVIKNGVRVGYFPNGILIYLYAARSTSKDRVPKLSRDELLLPPLAINRLPWSRGYFETVASRPLGDADVLRVHCFRDFTGKYFDEMGRPLAVPSEPVGEFGLHSYRSLDDLISDVLGLPRSSELDA